MSTIDSSRRTPSNRTPSSGGAVRRVRGFSSVVLLFLAAVLAFSANGTWWATRTVFNTEEFVSTSESTMRQPEVQTALSRRMSDAVVTRGDVQARISQRLPEGLALLAEPLTDTARTVIERAALRLLQSPAFQALVDRALRIAHSHILAILEDDGTALRTDGTSVTLDLQPLVERVKGDLGGTSQYALLSDVTLPPDAGTIVLVDNAGGLRAASLAAQNHRTIVVALALAALVSAMLAVAVAPRRRVAVRRTGIALVIVGALSIIVLAVARYPLVSLARDHNAATIAYNHFTVQYRWQSLWMIVAGLVVAGVAVLAGDSHAARAVRGIRRSDIDARAELRSAARPLFLGAVAVTTLILLAWPQPGAKVYATALILLAIFSGALFLAVSEASWAQRARDYIEDKGQRQAGGRTGDRGGTSWFARNVRFLEIGGVIVAGLALMFVPGMNSGLFTLIVMALVLWVAGLELARAPS